MRKTLLTIMAFFIAGSLANAQTVLYDNGPLFDASSGTGIGLNGANVSFLHDGNTTLGTNNNITFGFRQADEFTVPSGESWNIDSLVFYAYQTGSSLTSTISVVNINIWDGSPDNPNSTVIFGDGVTNVLAESNWSGVYRTADFGSPFCPPASCTSRPIMRSSVSVNSVFSSGTYWLDWQSGGTLQSGPWAPPINLGSGITTTGNALQYVSSSATWQVVQDTVPANGGNPAYEPIGLPFLVVGSILTGVDEINPHVEVSLHPNPMNFSAIITINNQALSANESFTFVLYDILGNVVRKMEQIRDKQFTLERGSLSKGAYFYEMLKGNDSLKKGKLIIH
jgi:type IX secretion system substrate protein